MTKQPIGWFYGNGEEFTECPELASHLREQGVELIEVYGVTQPYVRLRIGLMFAALVVVGWLMISDHRQARAQVASQIAELAQRADNETFPPVFPAAGDLDPCFEILQQLSQHGYTLEIERKPLITDVDMAEACIASELITIRRKYPGST